MALPSLGDTLVAGVYECSADKMDNAVDMEKNTSLVLTVTGSCGEETPYTPQTPPQSLGLSVDDVPNYLPKKSRIGAEIGSENQISDEDLRLAATLVDDAMEGRTNHFRTEPRYVRSYNLYKSFILSFLLYLAVVVNLSLALFEEPAVEHLALPYWVTMPVELVCLLYCLSRLVHHAHWQLWRSFWRDLKTIFIVLILLLTLIDMVMYITMKNISTSAEPVRWSRAFRPILIVNYSDGRQLRRAWRNIRRTIRQILHVIFLFYFFIIVFALVAYKMFQHRDDLVFPDGSPYFKSYSESFWLLYILVTTANNPDVMMPAYNKNRWYCLFFTFYVILCLYLLLNILLAVTYYSYRENMKEEIKQSSRRKRTVLQQAFDVIKIHVSGQDMVTYRTWYRLIRLAHPAKTKNQIDLLMLVLDTDKSGYISRQQFMGVADLLNVPLTEVEDRKTFLERHCPAVVNNAFSRAVQTAVNSIFFRMFFNVVVLVNVVMLALNINTADWAFFCLFVLEIVLKWTVYGTKRYLSSFLNWMDVLITLLSLFLLTVTELQKHDTGGIDAEALSVISVFRIFRMLRVLTHFKRFKIILNAVVNVSLSILTYCGILFIVFYMFAVAGMELFKNKLRFLGYNDTNPTPEQLNCGNEALNGSAFSAARYCRNNFNDIINAFVVLSALIVVNNWHILAEGFALVTGIVARAYFLVFHLTVAVVIVNILTAFILDMFMYEYTLSTSGKHETRVEMKIKELGLGIDDDTGREISKNDKRREAPTLSNRNGTKRIFQRINQLTKRSARIPTLSKYDGVRFHLKKRGWTKVELLLQQLFEVEGEHTDLTEAEETLF